MLECYVLFVLLLGGLGLAPLEVVASVAPLDLAQAGVEVLGVDDNDWQGTAVATAWTQRA